MGAKDFLNTHLSTYNLYKEFFSPKRLFFETLSFFKDYVLGLGRGFPTNINLALTLRCNQNCDMCFDKATLNKGDCELSYIEIKNFIDSVKGRSPLFFITGGEPFLYKDIFKVMEYLRKNKLAFGVCTNGSALNDAMIRRLVHLAPANVVFSIHGLMDAHDKVTGRSGNYQRTKENIKLFCRLKKRTRVMINLVLMPENAAKLKQFITEAESWEVDAIRIQHLGFLTPAELKRHRSVWKKQMGEASPAIHELIISKPCFDFKETVKEIQGQRFNIPVWFKPYLKPEEVDSWYSDRFGVRRRCLFLWKGVFVASNGDVFPCHVIKLKLGNIKEKSLEEIYNSEKAKKFRRAIKRGLMPGCSRCCRL
ncbi:MAG: radical SAM protein [archaeon]